MIEEILQGLASTLSGSGITFYYNHAPQTVVGTHGIVDFVSSKDDYTFTEQGESFLFMIKLVGHDAWPKTLLQNYETAHSLVQDSSITVLGYSLMKLRRESRFNYRDSTNYWHVGGIYQINLWRN